MELKAIQAYYQLQHRNDKLFRANKKVTAPKKVVEYPKTRCTYEQEVGTILDIKA